jgi:glutathione S-transferase
MSQAAADPSSAVGQGASPTPRDGHVGLPVLYSFRRCPYAMRARLAIAASGQRCELREVVLRDKPPSLIAASPKATVPVLVLPDGTVLAQSLDIMRWALGCHDPDGWLPRSPSDIALVDALIAQCDGEFKQHLDRYKYPNRYAQAEAGGGLAPFAAMHRTSGAVFLSRLEALLNTTGPGDGPRFLCGDRWSFADAAIAPFVRQFAATEPAWFGAQPWPALQAWLADFCASSRYLAVMDKHPPWQEGAAGVPFPRENAVA